MTRRMVGTLGTLGRTALVLGAALAGGGVALADTLALDINDDAARLTFAHPFSGRENVRLDASWLHHQDTGDAIAVGLHITGNAASESRPINAGLGGRFYIVDADGASADGSVVAVGGFFAAKLPTYDRVGFGGHAYYAPDVLAFGDAEDLLDFSLHASYSVLRQGEVYAGVRNVKIDFGNRGELTLDTGLFVGFSLEF